MLIDSANCYLPFSNINLLCQSGLFLCYAMPNPRPSLLSQRVCTAARGNMRRFCGRACRAIMCRAILISRDLQNTVTLNYASHTADSSSTGAVYTAIFYITRLRICVLSHPTYPPLLALSATLPQTRNSSNCTRSQLKVSSLHTTPAQ